MEWKISSLKDLEHYFWRCTACGTCRSAYDFGPPPFTRPICPAGTEFGFEGYYSSKGKAAFARGISDGSLTFDDPEFLEAIYKCTVCGGCQNQCQVDYKPHIPEIIEAMRREAVQSGAGPLPAQKNHRSVHEKLQQPLPGSPSRAIWTGRVPSKKPKHPSRISTRNRRKSFFMWAAPAPSTKPPRRFHRLRREFFKNWALTSVFSGKKRSAAGPRPCGWEMPKNSSGWQRTTLETFKTPACRKRRQNDCDLLRRLLSGHQEGLRSLLGIRSDDGRHRSPSHCCSTCTAC